MGEYQPVAAGSGTSRKRKNRSKGRNMLKGVCRMRGAALVALMASVPLVLTSHVSAIGLTLQNASADFSQPSLDVSQAIDGITTGSVDGWAIDPQEGLSHWATFETAVDAGFAGGSILTFTLYQGLPLSLRPPDNHQLGRFSLAVTTDPRGSFSTWTVLDPSIYTAANGATLTKQGDNSLLASLFPPTSETTYTVTATTALTGITGIRLEAIADASLPSNGPGTCPVNGNFVLEEIQVNISEVPEPGFGLLTLLGMGGLVVCHRLRRK
jgi:hypothetical protein